MLAAHGIRTAGDLLEHLPFRYEDRARFRPLASLRPEEWVLVRVRVASVGGAQGFRQGFSIFEMLVRDGSGAVRVKFFNQPYLRRLYTVGTRLTMFGQVKQDAYSGGALVLANPECEVVEGGDDGGGDGNALHMGRVVPIYRKLGDLRTRALRKVMHEALSHLPPELPDALPAYLARQLRLPPKAKALRAVHFPEVGAAVPDAERKKALAACDAGLSPAHKRFIFEELFQFQVGVRMVREDNRRQVKARRMEITEGVRTTIKKILPFHPTAAQKRVLKEIADDQCSIHPMSRLLQGDVGSGKTIVAAQAAVIAVENGCQAAVMAPTEILAEQHYFFFKRLFAPVGYGIGLLKGSLKAKEKKLARERVQSGETRIVIGTHALVEESVKFRDLGLVVIDEQHRFGVVQRNLLRGKGLHPDVLVMTATPIPRSLALTLYGDLDVSVIDELPPGRKPVATVWLGEKDRAQAFRAMRHTVDAGRQVYVVYPLVEESEKSDLRAAVAMAEHLKNDVFPDCRVGLLHGRMKSAEKEETMRAFAGGDVQILVSTTVIEVGVDVPNATLMVIEHAERFGLAQLHQLRGRVGRGSAASQCVLIGAADGDDIRKRMETMCATNDGFRIAQADLELRGPGELLGTRQSGVPAFKYADIVRDMRALEIARQEADAFFEKLRASTPDADCLRAAAVIRARWQARVAPS
jgi:ATP-dependent DNA helicase RecG